MKTEQGKCMDSAHCLVMLFFQDFHYFILFYLFPFPFAEAVETSRVTFSALSWLAPSRLVADCMHGQPREYVTSQSCNSFKAKELQCTSVKEENKKISVLFLTFVSFSNGCTFFFFFFGPYLMKKPWRWGQWTCRYLIFIRTNPFDCPHAVFFPPLSFCFSRKQIEVRQGTSFCLWLQRSCLYRRKKGDHFKAASGRILSVLVKETGEWTFSRIEGEHFFPSLPFLSVPSSVFFFL